jgi:molybdopterin-containing oxidoreductase family molybdopterin binding subunit
MISPFLDSDDREEMWNRFELPYRPEVMLNFGTNLMMAIANRETMARSLAKYKFMVSIDLFETETTRFADIVLPDCGYLRTFNSRSNFPFIFSHPAGMGNGAGDWPAGDPPEGSSAAIRTCCSNLPTVSASRRPQCHLQCHDGPRPGVPAAGRSPL